MALHEPLIPGAVKVSSAGAAAAGAGAAGHALKVVKLALVCSVIAVPSATLYQLYGDIPEQRQLKCRSPIVAGHIAVTINGTDVPMTLVSNQPWGVTLAPDGRGFGIAWGARAYLVTQHCPQAWTPELYADSPFVLLGSALSMSVDLSHLSCGCAGTVYLASMPGRFPNGTANPGKAGDYACVADTLGGCPEMDIVEANNMGLSVAPHLCVGRNATTGSYALCDADGCAIKTKDTWPLPLYGPGKDYLIDTKKAVQVTATFATEGRGASVSLDHLQVNMGQSALAQYPIDITNTSCSWDHPGYPQGLTEDFSRPMTLVFSVWGGKGSDFKWLDTPPCDESVNCDTGRSWLNVTNIVFTPANHTHTHAASH